MPNASLDQLRWEVAKRIHDLGCNGGYIIAPCHNIGHDISPQNIVAFFDLVKQFDDYPLALDEVLNSNQSYFANNN
jgi:uroporphyrinogen decarboxylase